MCKHRAEILVKPSQVNFSATPFTQPVHQLIMFENSKQPLLKGGPANDPNKFRPISILPVLSNLF